MPVLQRFSWCPRFPNANHLREKERNEEISGRFATCWKVARRVLTALHRSGGKCRKRRIGPGLSSGDARDKVLELSRASRGLPSDERSAVSCSFRGFCVMLM